MKRKLIKNGKYYIAYYSEFLLFNTSVFFLIDVKHVNVQFVNVRNLLFVKVTGNFKKIIHTVRWAKMRHESY